MTTLNQLSYILQQDCQLDLIRPVLIGVSGGPDSLCMLDLLWRHGYPLVVAHLNHGLRVEAAADEQAVRDAAHVRGLRFVSEAVDVHAHARNHALSIEEAARIVRYRFLFEQAGVYQAQAVAVAHTADDQVETVLMHLLRGAGLSGLKGMSYRMLPNPWSKDIALVRPFLGVFREDVLAYCSEFHLLPVFDRSNLDTTLFRNRIRQELIPNLQTYNPSIKSGLWRMSQTLTGDEQTLEQLTSITWKDCCLEQSEVNVALHVGKLLSQPLGVQRRVVRRAISVLRSGLRDVDYAMIDRTLSFLQQPSRSGVLDLADGLRLVWERDRLWITNRDIKLPDGDYPHMEKPPLLLAIPGRVDLPGRWQLQAEPVVDIQEAMQQATTNADPYRVWIDIQDAQLSLSIRPPQSGDRFKPLGMDGHTMKLSDFFINIKVLPRLRHSWPLVCIGDEIVWVPGYRLAHPFRLTSRTKRAVFLQFIKD